MTTGIIMALLCPHLPRMYAKHFTTMSNEHITTISEFELNLIYDFFSNTERQGPGSPEVTRRALSFIDNLTDKSLIADIGCGTGGQTMVLAAHAPGQITASDLFPGFIDQLNANAAKLNLQDRVKGTVCSMDDLPFGDEELDMIWCEGAIYNIGFERGLREWHRFLKTGGYVAVSESSWFTDKRPAEIENYCMPHFPEMDTMSGKLAIIEKAGYSPVAAFTLPENCWLENYFIPMARAQELLLAKYPGNKTAEQFVALQQHDEQMYRRYKEYYGYVFYIAKKVG